MKTKTREADRSGPMTTTGRSSPWSSLGVVLAFLVVIAAAAFAMGGFGSGGEPVIAEDPAAAADTGAGDAAGAEGAGVGETIEVSMTEFAFEPASLELEAGSYTFAISNDGVAPHQWALSPVGEHGEHIADTGELAAGETATLTVQLDGGVYEFACHVPGHYDAGMIGEMQVAGSDGTAPEAPAEPQDAPPAAAADDGTVDHGHHEMAEEHDDGAMDEHHATSGDETTEQGETVADDPAGAAQVIEVSMTEFAYAPASLELAAGTHTFRVTNDGQVPHELALAEAGAHHGHGAATPQLAPGETHELTVELEPGEYAYMCHIDGHLEAGMEASLTVTG